MRRNTVLASSGRRSARLSLFIALAGLAVAPLAQAKIESISSSSVTFTALGPAGMKITGTGSGVTVEDDGKALLFRFPLRTLTTGISLRDSHMHQKYLQDQTYPNAELRVSRDAVKIPGQTARGDVDGTLSLHGKSKGVRVHFDAARKGNGYSVSASFPVDIRDYGIEIPSYLGVTVKPAVDVSVTFTAAGSLSSATIASAK